MTIPANVTSIAESAFAVGDVDDDAGLAIKKIDFKIIKNSNEKRNGAEYFYQKYQLSLDGGEESEAAKLTTAIEEKNASAISGQDKFFLAFVESDSEEWKTWKDGFQEMQNILSENKRKSDDKKDQNFISKDGSDFKLYTIFIDQQTKETKDADESAFEQYYGNHVDYFFNEAATVAEETYYGSSHISESQINSMLEPDGSFFKSTATIMLIDMSPAESFGADYKPGVNEVMFGVPSGLSKSYELAKYLMDCWNHTGDFSL